MSCKIDQDQSKVVNNGRFLKLIAANNKGQTIGIADASILETNKKFLWLDNIQVDPKCRNQGVGKGILQELKALGKLEKAELIYAFPASPSNVKQPIEQKDITHFYTKNGFKPCTAPDKVFTVTNDGGIVNKGGVCLKLK